MTTADVLALPRDQAFARGLLVPVASWRRRRHQIPFPVRFTPAAWDALVTYAGPRGRVPDAHSTDVRLGRALDALSTAIRNVGVGTFSARMMTVAMPPCIGRFRYAAEPLRVTVLTTPDEERRDTLTVMLPAEAPAF
jgi:hypothetical protein